LVRKIDLKNLKKFEKNLIKKIWLKNWGVLSHSFVESLGQYLNEQLYAFNVDWCVEKIWGLLFFLQLWYFVEKITYYVSYLNQCLQLSKWWI